MTRETPSWGQHLLHELEVSKLVEKYVIWASYAAAYFNNGNDNVECHHVIQTMLGLGKFALMTAPQCRTVTELSLGCSPMCICHPSQVCPGK